MSLKIVSDSSANVFSMEGIAYTTVPLKIRAGEQEYVDDGQLDVRSMVDDLKIHKGKSGSSCPNVGEWLDAYEGDQNVFALTISKNLSGSYNAAVQAGEEFREAHPGRKLHVFNTLTAGPQQIMMAEKIRELADAGESFERIIEKVEDYQSCTYILFCLESLTNLARNGRVHAAVAKIAGVLGIRVLGCAKGGEIVPEHKIRGGKKATQKLVEMMLERGLFDGAKVRIAHCFALEQAEALKAAVLEKLPNCSFVLEPTAALCSYYAEEGGLMIGFEGAHNPENSCKNY